MSHCSTSGYLCHNNVVDGVVIHCLTHDMINKPSVEYLPDKCI